MSVRLAATAFTILLSPLFGCGGSGGSSSFSTAPAPMVGIGGTITGAVVDENDTPIGNVLVTAGSGSRAVTRLSNEQGFFSIPGVVAGGETVVRFERSGFVTNYKSVEVRESRDAQQRINMRTAGTTQIIDTTQLSVIAHQNGTISLPANSIVDESGQPVAIAVVQLTSMSPGDTDFEAAMPGDFQGLQGALPVRLRGLGVLDVQLRDMDDNPLRLASGAVAELVFPIPPSVAGLASLPLWRFDPETGLWRRQDAAFYDVLNQVYRATVTDIAAWSINQRSLTGTQVVRLSADGRPGVGVTIRIEGDGWMSGGVTDSNGELGVAVTATVPGRPSRADVSMLRPDGTWVTLQSQADMPQIDETEVDAYTESDGVSRAAATVILGWDELPSDLDANITVPTSSGRSRVFWADPGRFDLEPFCSLETDDIQSFGPEIVAIARPRTGVYRYVVHNLSGEGQHPIIDSGATVTVVVPGQPTRVFTPPISNPTSQSYWAVFDMRFDGGGKASFVSLGMLGGSELLNP